jgi:hypothetical protein
MAHKRATLANVNCTRYQFMPGDRILVEMYRNFSGEEIKKFRRTIEKWAGCEVEVLFYNANEVKIRVEQGYGRELQGRTGG